MPDLPWPEGWPRTPALKRDRGDFGKTVRPTRPDGTASYPRKVGLQWNEAMRRVQLEVQRMHGTQLRVDTAAGNDAEPGVIVSFRLPGGKPVVFPCDRYASKAQNAAAIAATIEAKRAIERHGASTLEREFEGYLQLGDGTPATANLQPRQAPNRAPTVPDELPHVVLGVAPDAPTVVVEGAWRALAKDAHPDRGGSDAAMHRITKARDAMLQARAHA